MIRHADDTAAPSLAPYGAFDSLPHSVFEN